ncbi:glycoside hydrolase family 31 protein [Lasallia pustulata]|uniref:alpha-glucosidase n=1 Tax=Lasallia pustulata TaxID=136370 RepID=A0A1W5CWH7_9LECA|nr:glycoside hydrolase family 31 protein [Lasallia pustulata]
MALEKLFLCSSSAFITLQAFQLYNLLGWLYVCFIVTYLLGWLKLRPIANAMVFVSPLSWFNIFLYLTILLSKVTYAQTSSGSATASDSNTTTSYRPIFTVPSSADNGANLLPNVYDSQAVNPQSVCPGYTASDVVRTPYGLTATLTLAGAACNAYGTDIETLNLTVEYQSADRLAVKIVPAAIDASNASQYILPAQLVHEPTVDADADTTSLMNDLSFQWSNEPTFSFAVYRVSTGDMLFSTMGTKLVFENQFIEFGSPLPENYNLYGLATSMALTHSTSIPVTTNETNATADYISYSHGVYLRNAHGQEILLRPSNITWRTLGGSIDLYFFPGPSQPEVTMAYQRGAIGLPVMQQYWTFGFHQCRWGYQNWSVLDEVVNTYEQFAIPLETIWTDIDYMKEYRDFENDPIRFSYSTGQDFLSRLHASGRHYIPIVDSAIYVPNPDNASDAYTPFTAGNATGSFMTNPDGSLYIGDVWPGYTVFPDWLSGGAGQWWIDSFKAYYDNVHFDGIWIDMSEASSFCVGSCGSGNLSMNPVHPPFSLPGEPGAVVYDYPEGFNLTNATEAAAASSSSSVQAASAASAAGPAPTTTTTPSYLRNTPTAGVRDINHPPYVINNVQGDLAVHAVSPNATHADGTEEYDVHNLFGHETLNATYNALLNVFPGNRPFIIGRSTFAGSGVYAGHWGGDNFSKFLYMYFSIPQALSFSLFGIPMFGVDTCGFQGNSDEELCSRWMQLSAFFPFYRNHNDLSSISQEAYVWSSVIDATKTAMSIRFQLLPYMYTLFYLSHSTGSTVMRALSWEFPNEPSLADADRQFLLGPAIMVTPVLVQGATTVDGVFPGIRKGEVWYDWYSQQAVSAAPGENVTIPAPLGTIPIYVRGGYVLPMQQPAMTTTEARKTPWSVLVALGLEGTASGELYLDDGQSVMPNATLYVELTAANSVLHAFGRGSFNDTNPLANVTILGVQQSVSNVTFNGMSVGSGVEYNNTSKVMTITGLNNATANGAWTSDWVLAWK